MSRWCICVHRWLDWRAVILEWVGSDMTPFTDPNIQCKHLTGYLSTAEVHGRLVELISCGDVEYDASEPLSVSDVGVSLSGLYARQQQQFESLGILSCQRLGIGRLWRIVPPSGYESGQPFDGLTHKLFRVINAETS